MLDDDDWSIKPEDRQKYAQIFESLGPENGKLSGEKAKPVLVNSGLPMNILGKIWELSDIDRDGFLDRDEMTVALHLVYCALKNDPTPNALPHSLVPPAKRAQLAAAAFGSGGAAARRTSLPNAYPVLPGPPPLSAAHRPRTGSMTSLECAGLGGGAPAMANFAPLPTAPATGSTSRSLTSTPTPQVFVQPAPWPVDKARWEPIFHEADRDHDGLVNGNDVKQLFIQSGLTQNYLAHIWSLADLRQSGSLNLEQFALAMHLMELKRVRNVEPPPVLPLDLVPPSFRSLPTGGMTDISTQHGMESNDHLSGLLGTYAPTGPAPQPTGNKEIDAIAKDIEQFQTERRLLDMSVHQLETDLTVKQSEIKNLELELNTLDATVRQIDQQKGQAQKRLDDLDTQRLALQNELTDLRSKLDLDVREVQGLGQEIEQTTASLKDQEEELNRKRQSLQSLRDEESKLEVKVQMSRTSVQQATQQNAFVEQQVKQTLHNAEQLKAHTTALNAKLAELQAFVVSDDVERDAVVLAPVQPLKLMPPQVAATSSFSSLGSTSSPAVNFGSRSRRDISNDSFKFVPPQPVDPFKSADPFASNGVGAGDPFAAHDPFTDGAAFADDPFKSTNDPFASSTASSGFNASFPSDPFSSSANDPFSSQSGQLSLPSETRPTSRGPPSRPPPPGQAGSGSKKPPPSRPAPPRSRPMTPKTPEPLDPWGAPTAASGGGGSDGFANFDDFGKFS